MRNTPAGVTPEKALREPAEMRSTPAGVTPEKSQREPVEMRNTPEQGMPSEKARALREEVPPGGSDILPSVEAPG